MPEYLPKFDADDAFTLTATGTITGGRLVNGAGAQCGADAIDFVGVAAHDAVAGDKVTVFYGEIQRLTATGALSADVLVKCAASGQITAYTSGTDVADRRVGVTLEAATGAGSVIAVRMR